VVGEELDFQILANLPVTNAPNGISRIAKTLGLQNMQF
jgi:hypothetical protein